MEKNLAKLSKNLNLPGRVVSSLPFLSNFISFRHKFRKLKEEKNTIRALQGYREIKHLI